MNETMIRRKRQEKLADLFFEMGMDLDLIEKISGIDKKDVLLKRINKTKLYPLTFEKYNSSIGVENRNSY